MRISPIYYPFVDVGVILRANLPHCNPIQAWLAFGKLPENPIVTPNATRQLIQPSAQNKYLQTVTVEPIPAAAPAPSVAVQERKTYSYTSSSSK